MKLKLIFLVLFLVISISYAQEIRNPELDFNLTKSIYVSNESILGTAIINFKGNIDPNLTLIASLNNLNYNKTLKDYLIQSNKSFREVQAKLQASNPGSSKIINFPNAGSNFIAFRLPANARVSRIDMNITGDGSAGANSNVSIDIGNDGTIDWKYIGGFKGFSSAYYQSASLDTNVQNSFTNLNDNITYLCEAIDLPLSKDFKIFANYKYNGTSTSGDINAGIFSLEGTRLTGGANACDLQEPTNDANWYSCNFSYSIPFGGTQLACIYSNLSGASYKVGIDPTPSQTAYKCTGSGNSITCSQFSFGDYFIRVQVGDYETGITSTVRLSGSNVQSNNQAIANAITDFLTSCTQEIDGYCIVPLKFSSASSGRLILQDLILTYEGIDYNLMHDLTVTNSYITTIVNNNLTNYSLLAPLSIFPLKAPTPSGDSSVYTLILSLGSASRSRDIKVYKNLAIQEAEKAGELTSTVFGDVNDAIDKLNKLIAQKKDLINNFGLSSYTDSNLGQLLDIKNQINLLTSANITLAEKQTKAAEIASRFTTIGINTPTNISIVNNVKDSFIPEPKDLDQYVGDDSKKEALGYQDKISVEIDATYLVIRTRAGDLGKTHVKKKITAKQPIDAFVYEEIPKNIASEVNKITFSDPGYVVVNNDPVVKWPVRLNAGESKVYSYVVDGNLVSSVQDTKTLVLTDNLLTKTKGIKEEKEKYKCGDNICTKPFEDEIICPQDCKKASFPWVYVIIGVVVILVGVFYLNFYRGKGNIRELTKMPFASKQDLTNIINFIKSELNKGVKKEDVSKKLISKGWNSEQVLYAFDEVDFEKERVKVEAKTPTKSVDLQPAKDFIEKALKIRMDQAKINSLLLAKGWTKEQVDSAYKETSKLK